MAIDLKAALRANQPPARDQEVANRELGGGTPSTNGAHIESQHERRIVPTKRGGPSSTRVAQDVHRELPHAVEAEQGVLSSIIRDARYVIPICRQWIDESYFYVPAHQTVYTLALELFAERGGLDWLTLTQYVKDVGLEPAIGGPSMILHLSEFVPTAANIIYYLELLREKYILRQIIATNTESVRRAYEEQDEVNALVLEVVESNEALKRLCGSFSDVVAVSLMELAGAECDPAMTLLGNRFLCRGSGMLFVGPSGIGKSSASVQQDVMWSLGREAFGIRPTKPLRILCIQAENDAGDLGEMARGVCDGLGLTPGEREQVRDRVWYVAECSRVGDDFLRSVVRPLLTKIRPDILRLDPLLAYLGGDVSDQTVTSAFLRHGLNPLLSEFSCGAIINHHTPKVTNRDTSAWRTSDWMYAGAGSADVTNWARPALVIDPTHAPRVFKMIAAKRGTRIGWVDEDGQPTFERLFSHSIGSICWHEATAEDEAQVEASKPRGARHKSKTKEDLKALVPLEGEISKNALIADAQSNGIGVNAARGFIAQLLDSNELFQRRVSRQRTNPEIRISRSEPVLGGG